MSRVAPLPTIWENRRFPILPTGISGGSYPRGVDFRPHAKKYANWTRDVLHYDVVESAIPYLVPFVHSDLDPAAMTVMEDAIGNCDVLMSPSESGPKRIPPQIDWMTQLAIVTLRVGILRFARIAIPSSPHLKLQSDMATSSQAFQVDAVLHAVEDAQPMRVQIAAANEVKTPGSGLRQSQLVDMDFFAVLEADEHGTLPLLKVRAAGAETILA